LIVACHQPLFLPWPGLFFKALKADLLVLLDHVAFPMGTTWVSRNRIKNEGGPFWLTVPVMKKGHRNAPINTIKIFNGRDWRRKHLSSIRQAYAHAPYLEDHLPFFSDLYARSWGKLIHLNVTIFEYLKKTLDIKTPYRLSSQFGLQEHGSSLLVEICRRTGADIYCTAAAGKKYLDESAFEKAHIDIAYYCYNPPTYPQLWGEFAANLSVVDMLFCCGPKSGELVQKSGFMRT
jgi:hypothetical protein